MASDPDGEQSDQSDNPVNSEVVMNCVGIFYEEGKGVEKFRCLGNRGERRLGKFRETINLPQQYIDYRHFISIHSMRCKRRDVVHFFKCILKIFQRLTF